MTCIGYIGLGLIGGSLARFIRKFHPEYRQIAYSHTKATTDAAIEAGVIDEALTQDDPRFGECDFIFLCAPVRTNIGYLPFLRKTIKENCILTDVGSVKGETMKAAAEAGLSANFIGGHPMAGTEKTGFANSTDYLLENAYYFITPSEDARKEDISRYEELLSSIRALPLVVSPEKHDFIVAGVSHLPHIVASVLVNTVKDIDTDDERMKLVAAGGFRDITRIASSSPTMWQQICMANKDAILEVLDTFTGLLQKSGELVRESDTDQLYQMFESSKNYRDSIDDVKKGSVPRQYVLYISIMDETGAIATITTMLAMSQISIKNIGILHTREYEEGALRIEFYDEAARDQAETILNRRNYIVKKKI
jgi:prephenate dehydrogenase